MARRLLPGVHVPHFKNTAHMKPVVMDPPAQIVLPMRMHIGAPAKPVVKAKDPVLVGQLVAEAGGFVSSPIYAGVSGTVKKIEDMLHSDGTIESCIVIESDGLMEKADFIPPEVTDFDSFIEAVRNSGVVGMGGAGFPTAVKLKVDPDQVEYICINGAECEPFITSDTRMMRGHGELLCDGIEWLKKFYPKAKVILGIEKNKPHCIGQFQEMTQDMDEVEVCALPALYPQGGEKVLIYNTTGRIVPEGKLPIDVGCIVINTTTLISIATYIKTGEPLTAKCITVDGSAIAHPMNVIVPIGTSIEDVVAFTGGYRSEPKKILYGGPMMGVSIPDAEKVILKTTNAITCFDEKDSKHAETTACIHCGSCIDACPLNLMPVLIEKAFKENDVDRLEKLKVNVCMECGCCSFVCPAKRPLVENHKLAKAKVAKAVKARQAKEAKS